MGNTKDGKVWTEEELELVFDTDRPTTIGHDRRCAWRYKGVDYRYRCVVPMRCINAATVSIHVVENPYESYDAVACDTCASRLNEPLPEVSSSSPSFGVVGGNTVTIIGRL